MPIRRRDFLTATAAALTVAPHASAKTITERTSAPTDAELLGIASAPMLNLKSLAHPILIESMDLLKQGSEYLVRVRSKDGLEAVVAPNSKKMRDIFPIFLNRIAPFFAGKDARKIEFLLHDLYRDSSNYKFQGMPFWICVAVAEIAILDLLGKASGKSIAKMFGGAVRRDIPVYPASGNRGNKAKDEIRHLKKLVDETDADAVKFRLGGRMSNNKDSRQGRDQEIIPLARREFGDKMTLYADSNSSYDVKKSIRIGRVMEQYNYAFFEEPVPFDHLWETKEVTAALDIPIAGGEQEFSMRRFRWAIANRVTDIVQPDLHYFGGFIRSTKVARMAQAAGMDCTCHMSGGGLGYLYILHFASFTPNAGPFQEYKGTSKVEVECDTSDLKCRKGKIQCPTGPGLGITINKNYLQKAKIVKLS
jgi:L-alanine-DL-glutamate epimerase-like enolase superfamily enzyme